MENNTCEYAKKYLKKTKWLGNEMMECSVDTCPYRNLKTLTYEAGDQKIEICETKGLIKKLEEKIA